VTEASLHIRYSGRRFDRRAGTALAPDAPKVFAVAPGRDVVVGLAIAAFAGPRPVDVEVDGTQCTCVLRGEGEAIVLDELLTLRAEGRSMDYRWVAGEPCRHLQINGAPVAALPARIGPGDALELDGAVLEVHATKVAAEATPSPPPDTPGAAYLVPTGSYAENMGVGRIEIRDGDVRRIGRHPSNDVVIPHATVAKSALELAKIDGRLTLRDEGTLCGTYVNRGAIPLDEPFVLVDGDTVQLGALSYRVVVPDS